MKMGIFWFYNQQVLGIAHDINLHDVDSLGLVDSPYTHIDYWQKIQQTRTELHGIEYEEIPRGRMFTVIFMMILLFIWMQHYLIKSQ